MKNSIWLEKLGDAFVDVSVNGLGEEVREWLGAGSGMAGGSGLGIWLEDAVGLCGREARMVWREGSLDDWERPPIATLGCISGCLEGASLAWRNAGLQPRGYMSDRPFWITTRPAPGEGVRAFAAG